jgi:branched-chain amino acid transport system ATP-binding protein
MLELNSIEVRYGAAVALRDVSLRIAPGELVCVVGPNGAGKTTLINVMAGIHRAASGSIRLDGKDLTQLPAHRFCDQGVAIVPEGRRLFTTIPYGKIWSWAATAPAPRRTGRNHSIAFARCSLCWLHASSGRPGRCREDSNKWWRSRAH